MLNELLSNTALTDIVAVEQPAGDWPEHTYPSPADLKRFTSKGHKFDQWGMSDLKGLVGRKDTST